VRRELHTCPKPFPASLDGTTTLLDEKTIKFFQYYSYPQNFVVLTFFLSIKGGANFEPPTSVHKKRILTR
jgi:hypothetical protein